jgi:methyltransferase (TIGR00027 family)
MSDLEQWDIVTGVGVTALGVAAGRSMETHRADGLVADPFAESFVEAARPPEPMPTRLDDHGATADPMWSSMSTYIGVRSRFFDRYFEDAVESGIDQLVLLASGLDTRAYRLDLPGGCRLFEIDQPKVLEFKEAVLEEQGASPRCDRVAVAIDLREDWPSALRKAGFDPDRPTAWLAEGLLPYLPADAERALFTNVDELSGPGSRIAIEYIRNEGLPEFDDEEIRRTTDRMGIDIADLWHVEGKGDPTVFLTDRGWSVRADSIVALADSYQRSLEGMMAGTAQYVDLLVAHNKA